MQDVYVPQPDLGPYVYTIVSIFLLIMASQRKCAWSLQTSTLPSVSQFVRPLQLVVYSCHFELSAICDHLQYEAQTVAVYTKWTAVFEHFQLLSISKASVGSSHYGMRSHLSFH